MDALETPRGAADAPSPVPPPTAVAAAVFLSSVAMLMFQILQSVTLSLQVFHTTAFLVISLSMFGLGTGGSLASVWIRRGGARRPGWLWGVALANALALLAAGVLNSRLSALEALIATSVVPYLTAGLMLSVIFQRWPERSGRLYCFNLLGSGVGCIALVAALDGLGDAGRVQLLIAGVGAAAALCLAAALSRRALAASMAALLGVAALVPFSEALFVYLPAKDKPYGRILRDPSMQSALEWSKWGYLGRLDAVVPGPGIEDYAYAGEWVRDREDGVSESRLLFANGGNWATSVDFNGDTEYRARFLRETVAAAPYILFDAPEVLSIGVGAGVDLFLALEAGARSVVGVEINPLMLEALERYAGFFDHAASDPRVTLLETDGRTYVDQTQRRFDVITVTAVDTGAAIGAGPYVLSENYLYTREAMHAYLSRLREDGVLFVYRPSFDIARVLATAASVLREQGVADPERHLAAFGRPRWIGALISRAPLSKERAALLDRRLASGDFGGNAYFVPGVPTTRLDPFFEAMRADREMEYLASLRENLTPIVDDRPFFYHYDHSLLRGQAGRFLLQILAILAPTAALMIFAPLLGSGLGGPARVWLPTLGYFVAIGFGFMLIEIALVQKLVLFLGHPTYSLTVTLFSILVFSGLGSLLVDRQSALTERLVAACLPAVVGVSAFYALGLQPLLGALEVSSLPGRAAVAACLLAPGSVLMGMPFPSMMRRLGRDRRTLVSWAWGVNGFASVVASIAAVMVSMAWGFTATLLAGALCYGIALACAVALRR